MSKANEVESPILTLEEMELDWINSYGYLWACADKLARLFEIGTAEKIVFVAKPRADKSTYQVEISERSMNLKKPERTTIYYELRLWLHEQIAAGRPHIGVRIIK